MYPCQSRKTAIYDRCNAVILSRVMDKQRVSLASNGEKRQPEYSIKSI